MTIIDTHTHLDHLENVADVLKRASDAHVESIISVGVDLESNKKNLTIKKKSTTPKVFIALGIHPGNINPEETEECIQFIRDNIAEAVAIGETGLDYWYKWVRKNLEERQKQKDVFVRQLELGNEFDLPVIIHSRGAWKDCIAMTKEANVKKALFHWYSGPVDILEQIIESGYYVSTTPSLAYSPESQRAILEAPIDRILLETDSPVHYKDGESRYSAEPKDVFRTLKAYAELKGVNEEEALAIFNRNAVDFFNLN